MKSAALALLLIPAGVLAQAGHLDEHGAGQLDVVYSDTSLTLSLVAPGSDIVGLDGPAETDDERALVAIAISDLSNPLELFALTDEAGCFTTSSNVTFSGRGLRTESSNESAADRENHAEFQADYQVQCQDIDAIESIQFIYFDRFPKAEKLIVHVDGFGHTRSQDITRAAPKLTF
ncbi:ZrgA family zinc uptake protein [Ruegeria lacuscaerulensis]|uniref:ZrgA family zinc uptake protein n=1 Tax=Ruegeria lacuscaerulensis TaxID=55218 RepID=UPI001480BE32|nr:DUF2796 domain-containing protein [Ruegeria lacuscaerulensis]